jgi:predicted permease
MLHILIIITPLFLIIFASAVFQRARNLGEEWISVLNEYALKIGLPILIFSSLSKARFSFAEQAPLILANSLLLIGTFFVFAVALKPFKMPEKKYKTILICLMFSNVAYLGIPVLSQLYGETVLPTTSLIIAVHVFWFFTLGIGYLDFLRHSSSESIFKDIAMGLVKNPLLISVALGILVAATRIVVPDVLMIATDMVSASVTPTVLIVVGLFIGRSTIGSVRAWIPVFVFSLATLTVIPALFYLSIRFADATAYWVAPSLIESAMPLAITPFALADTYELDKEFIARSIVLSTIVAVLTLPFWISLVQ